MTQAETPTPQPKGPRAVEVTPDKLEAAFKQDAVATQVRDTLAVLQKLPEHLRAPAAEDLQLRLQEWLTKWDDDDSELEPEEPLSDEEPPVSDEDKEGTDSKKRRQAPPVPSDGYPSQLWARPPALRPGGEGFCAFARSVLRDAGDWQPPSLGNAQLLPQQRTVATLVHPASPVHRLLVDHNTGSGKTLLMLRILDNFYFDARAKIVIFPKESVCDNFYKSVLEWPTRWRDYFASQHPSAAAIAAGCADWRTRRSEKWDLTLQNAALQRQVQSQGTSLQKVLKKTLIVPLRSTLEMKRAFRNGAISAKWLDAFWSAAKDGDDVHPPTAPLRAYRFTSAGGRAAAVEDGVPNGCVFKIGFDPRDPNPYSNKIVVMDEGHHLIRPHPMYAEQLGNLRDNVREAKNMVFALCTGTVAEDSVHDPRGLLDLVKGRWAMDLSDEGYLSTHHKRGAAFPRELPPGVSDGALTGGVEERLVHSVELDGEALLRYIFQEVRMRRAGSEGSQLDAKLANYTNMHVYFGSCGHPSCKDKIMSAHRNYVPKFADILDMVKEAVRARQKVVVMISRRTGYKALLELLRQQGSKAGYRVAELASLADFNGRRNAHGEQYAVMLADSDQASEGVEFYCVRLHILVDVPASHAAYVQRASRSVRCLGHSILPEKEREVRFALFVARLPSWAQQPLGAFLLFAFAGYWSPTVRKTYGSTEPPAAEVIAAAEKLMQTASKHNISDDEVSIRALSILVMNSGKLPTKLMNRLIQAYVAMQRGDSELPAELPEDAVQTADERLLVQLRSQARELAPAVKQMRCGAIDEGMY